MVVSMITLVGETKQVVKVAGDLTISDSHPSSERSPRNKVEANSCGTSNQSSRKLHCE